MSSDQSKPEGSLKKQLISLGIIVVLVIGGWYLSAVVSEAIFQRGKYDSVDILDDTDPFPVDLDAIAPPNFTPPEDWSGFSPDLLNLLAGLPFLAGALGNFSDLDQLNTVAFRVYERDMPISDDDLWRLSAFDSYQGNGWARSDAANYPFSEASYYKTEDFIVRVPFGDTDDGNMALPAAFPQPQIVWVEAQDSSNANHMSTYDLNIDSQNGSTIAFQLDTTMDGNMTYGIYKPYTPDESYYDNGYHSQNAPTLIKNRYLQFPNNDKTAYYNSHPYFQSHVNSLSVLLAGIEDTFTIADTIRDYIVSNFSLDLTFPLERPGSGDDIVEWFLEREEGLPMDFAAAFVMLCRWFGVPSRYTMGYNSRYNSNQPDPYFYNYQMREIRMSNMDAWNEIYFPLDNNTGEGAFAPFILSPSISFPNPGNGTSTLDLNIRINGTYSTMNQGLRGYTAHLDFEMAGEQIGDNVSQELQLYDYTEEVSLGSVYTDGNGYANYDVVMDNSFTAGAHFIGVQHSIFQQNACAIVLADAVAINAGAPMPNSINRSISNVTDIYAFIYDPVNNNRVKNAILHPVLTQSSAAITNSIIPSGIKVDSTGTIDQTVTISEYVIQGTYEYRVDFNGTYEIINPLTGSPEIITIPLVNDASSNTYPFQVIDDNQKFFNLDIDSTVFQEDTFYKTRSNIMAFNVYLEQAGIPVVGGTVNIYDRTYGNTLVTSIITGPGGTGTTVYSLSSDWFHWVAGVHELYGVWNGRYNQSFYLIVDEYMEVILNPLTPDLINRTGGGQMTFDVDGYLWDPNVGANIRYGYVGIQLRQGPTDYTSSLTGDLPYIHTGNDGVFSATYGVAPSTPVGIYQVYAGFNGDWELTNSRNQWISEPSFATLAGPESLTINDPTDITIEMWIDGAPTQSTYYGTVPNYNRNDVVRIDIQVWESFTPKTSATVTLYDETLGRSLGSQVTNSTGGTTFFMTLDSNHVAGLNLISVSHNTIKNYTQVHLDDTMYVHLTTTPAATSVRGTGQVTVSGVVRDALNDEIVKGAYVRLYVRDFGGLDLTGDITTWLLGTSSYQLSSESTGVFTFAWRMPVSFHGIYRITVEFDGNQQDSSIECPASNYNAGLIDLSSEYLQTVYAKVNLVATYSPQIFVAGQPVYVDGTLAYDNTTVVVGATVTIKFYDSSMSLLYSDTDTTDGSGNFSYSTTVLWSIDSIYVEFVQDDINYIAGTEVQATYA